MVSFSTIEKTDILPNPPSKGDFWHHPHHFPFSISLFPFLRPFAFALAVFAGAGAVVSAMLALVPEAGAASFLDRFGEHLKIFFTFDYAGRTTDNFPLADVLWHRSRLSATLIGGALAIALALGVPAGLWTARHPYDRCAKALGAALDAFSSMPVLVLGLLAILLATRGLGLPPFRLFLAAADGPALVLIYLLPMLTLALGDGLLAEVVRRLHDEATRFRRQPYVRALRARGVPVRRHLARHLAPPLLLLVAEKIAYLIGASVVVEYLFGWPGLGFQILDILTTEGAKDEPFLLAATALFAGVAVVFQLGSALAVAASDPRLRATPA